MGESRICHNITIVNDDECEEPAEFFFSNLALGAVGDPPISLTNTPARITIDDTDEPECSELISIAALLDTRDYHIFCQMRLWLVMREQITQLQRQRDLFSCVWCCLSQSPWLPHDHFRSEHLPTMEQPVRGLQ